MVVDGQRVFAGFIRDITARKNAQIALSESEQRFRHLAHFDSLTGLPNRTFLCEQLTECLSRPLPEQPMLSLLLLDLDRFKNVNDSLGHAAGDLLLCEVARRLLQCVREGDIVARLGGDEFAVVLRNSGTKGRAAECDIRTAFALGNDNALVESLRMTESRRQIAVTSRVLREIRWTSAIWTAEIPRHREFQDRET
jgi:diguanylate cyclase (GGDEF)-like protein